MIRDILTIIISPTVSDQAAAITAQEWADGIQKAITIYLLNGSEIGMYRLAKLPLRWD